MEATMKVAEAVNKVEPEVGCKHYWIIDTPSGPMSKGRCRLCGLEREFKNYLDVEGWSDFFLESSFPDRTRFVN